MAINHIKISLDALVRKVLVFIKQQGLPLLHPPLVALLAEQREFSNKF